ncbi:MAG: hypothetical protein GY940_07685 [bacterium]|nr:hypothetical protein [bacterium]
MVVSFVQVYQLFPGLAFDIFFPLLPKILAYPPDGPDHPVDGHDHVGDGPEYLDDGCEYLADGPEYLFDGLEVSC